MNAIADKIMKRISSHDSESWVCTPKDFLDFGSREAVDQALSRLVKAGHLRRISRGLYDKPRFNHILQRIAPVNVESAVAAITRRDGIRVMPNGLVAANRLRLTNAVPAKAIYETDGRSRTIKIGERTVRFQHVSPRVMRWAGKPSAPVVQALRWLGKYAATDPRVLVALNNYLPDYVKHDLMQNRCYLPEWMLPLVQQIAIDGTAEA